jgi:hypothetical protein
LSQLQSDGKTGSLNYIPSSGWITGTYVFQAGLSKGDGLIQNTREEKFTLVPESITKAISWGSLGVIIGATLIVVLLVVLVVLYHRRNTLKDYY